MQKSMKFLWMLLAIAGLFVAGCKKDDIITPPGDQVPAGVTNEATAMKSMAVNDAFVRNDEQTFNDGEFGSQNSGNFENDSDHVMPLRFGRFITSVTRTVTLTVDSSDTVATALIEKDIIGVFKIKGLNGPTDTVVVEKPFNDKSTRKVIFVRVGRDSTQFWKNWRPVATSLVAGGTAPPNDSVKIQKVEVFLPNGDTLAVSDPTNYFLRYKWLGEWHHGRKDLPVLLPGQNLLTRVTVTSGSADTDLVTLRFGCDEFHRRRTAFHIVSETNNGDGTYTRVFEKNWTAHVHPGYFNAGVEAMTRGTVYDVAAAYSVSWWAIPYRVVHL